jgi:glycosyltransferase involved in cell wall biosynthesis
MHTISVVIPVLDDARLLERCLAALAAQSRPADEIVVVDNGSTDGSAEVARAAGARVVAERRRGIPAANAAGLDAASGDVLARLDADCVPPGDWLERIERAFDGDRSLSAITGTASFDDAGALVRWAGPNVYLAWYFWAMGRLLGHPPLFGSNLALRASAWRAMRVSVHSRNPDVHDDLDLSFQVLPGMQVRFDPGLGMRVSGRPFSSPASFALRAYRGLVTIAVNSRPSPRRRRAAISSALLDDPQPV